MLIRAAEGSAMGTKARVGGEIAVDQALYLLAAGYI